MAFGLAIAVHAGNYGHGFVFDDHTLVETNPRVHELDIRTAFSTPYWGVERNDGLYRPLTVLSFAVDWKLGGGGPGWFHAINDLLHGLVTVLVVLVSWVTTRRVFAGLAAGILFAAHPVHGEAVHWIAGRAELLAAVFVLSAVLVALVPRPLEPSRDRWRAALVVILGALALLSKEHGVLVIPLAILAVFQLGDRGPRVLRRLAPLALGFVLVLGSWIALREAAVGDPAYSTPREDNPLVARAGVARVVGGLAVGVRWIEQLVLPVSSSADYGAPRPLAGRVPVPIAASVTLAALAILVGATIRLRRTRPALAFWCAFVLLAYLPTSNLLFSTGTVFAERLLYLASAGICVLAGAGLAALSHRALAVAVLVIVASTYGTLSLARLPDWRSDRTLFEHEVAHRPTSARSLVNLANVIEDEDPPRADRLYREAQRVAPDYIGLHVSYGTYLLKRGDAPAALRHLTRADELYPGSPSTLLNLGTAYARLGRNAEAARTWERLVVLDPGNAKARQNLERLRASGGLTPSS